MEKMTGKPSIDKPWLKYYDEEVLNKKLPEKTIYEYITENNKKYPNRIALNYFGKKITYGQLFKNIDQTARAFRAYGIKEGHIVTICMPTIPETIYVYYALSKIGAIANMVDPRTSKEGIENYINEAKSKMLIMIDVAADKARDAKKKTTIEKIITVSPTDSLPLGIMLKKASKDINSIYEDKKEAGEALIAACAGLKAVSTGGKVGEYHGFMLSASYNMFSNAFELTIKGKCSYKLEIGKDPVGNMQRIHNTLSSIDRKLTESEQKLETVQQQLATAQEEVKKPFPKEAELNEKMERLSELNALLNMDEKGNETIMADEDIGREGSSTDSRDAIEEKELPETADRIHKPSILERLKQEKAQQNTAEQPSVQKAAKKKHEQEL